VRNQSIFTGVLNREVAFTALLANLLRHSGEFREAVHKFLTGKPLPSSSVEVVAEFLSDEKNRHDIYLKFEGVPEPLIIEVKVRSSCPPTLHQSEGRAEYTSAHWLVPRDWPSRHLIAVSKTREHTLEDLAKCLRKTLGGDPILDEFISYLELVFPTIEFTPAEKRIIMQDPKHFASAAIKLHRIVESVAERLCEQLPGGQAYDLKPEQTDEDYGYYIKKKGERNGYILWFGVWPWASCLLGTGFEAKWHPGLKPTGFAPTEDSNWMISTMNNIVDAADPVQAMYDKILEAIRLVS
jgi:hypothetical protein